jgi:hypothetical protein
MLCGIVPTVCNNVVKVSLITDIHYIEYPEEFISILNQKYYDFIYNNQQERDSLVKNNLI